VTGVTAGEPLERAYRRLLRCYPARHRRRHGDEMLGVLMAAARPGQRRPGAGEAVNLVVTALLIRLRGAFRGSAGQWRDTLALASIVLPLAETTTGMVLGYRILPVGVAFWTLAAYSPLPPLLLAILVLLVVRRAAAALAAAAVADLAVHGYTSAPFTCPSTDWSCPSWASGRWRSSRRPAPDTAGHC
jgi:hypothetical protein